MHRYQGEGSPVTYELPLRSCNTMSTDVDDGIEYFNTIVVQPHRMLVTNLGRGYHIRCKYQVREKTIISQLNVTSHLGTTPLTATAPMPSSSMKIFVGLPGDRIVAENVRIGDTLTLVVSIDEQDIYGMFISGCMVRDGLEWGKQDLINEQGCPVDREIMGEFTYDASKTRASVAFQAHKFPYTASVYYQCNVRLCIKHAGNCDVTPPNCDADGNNQNLVRRRRETVEIDSEGNVVAREEDDENLTIAVFSGLYVDEEGDLSDDPFLDTSLALDDADETRYIDPDSFCISPRTFAIGIAIAGLILMLAVIAAILVLVTKRRRKLDSSTTGSSIYSGPYSNAAFSHSS